MSIIRTDTTTSRTEAAEVLCELLCEVVQGMFLTIAKKGYTNESQSMVLEKEWFGGGGFNCQPGVFLRMKVLYTGLYISCLSSLIAPPPTYTYTHTQPLQ